LRNYFQITFKAIHPAESAAILIIAPRAWAPAQVIRRRPVYSGVGILRAGGSKERAEKEKEKKKSPLLSPLFGGERERLLARHAILSTRVEPFLITSTLEARSEERALAFFRKRIQENG